jgi:hypothetical protein
MMTKQTIGLWLDQRRAVIVQHKAAGEEITEILSAADRHPGHTAGRQANASHEAQLTEADDVSERKFTAQLQRYYAEIIECVRHAEAVFIMGPGEAKGHLRKQLADAVPKGCSVTVEPADKMTDRQIAARVREHFHPQHPVIAL